MPAINNLETPWTLHFDREGTEDVAIICDGNGEDLVRSRYFWLPEGKAAVPRTLASLWLMTAAPKLAAALASLLAAIDGLPISISTGQAYDAIYHARKALDEAATGQSGAESVKTIIVYIKDGDVTTVTNVPPGYQYVVKNLDKGDGFEDAWREAAEGL